MAGKDIDELSRMIGSIQSDVAHIRRTTEAIDQKTDKTNERVIENSSSLKLVYKRIDDMQVHVDDYRSVKQKGIGVITVVGMVFGFIGALVGKLFHYFVG